MVDVPNYVPHDKGHLYLSGEWLGVNPCTNTKRLVNV